MSRLFQQLGDTFWQGRAALMMAACIYGGISNHGGLAHLCKLRQPR